MAFNPFTSIRKHQKLIFASMAIVCMGLFVLSSGGGGDLLQQFTDWAMRRTAKVEPVASLDGKKIDDQALAEVRYRRQLADNYINLMTNVSHGRIIRQLFDERERVDPLLQQPISQFMNLQFFGQQLGSERFLAQLVAIQNQLPEIRRAIDGGTSTDKANQLRLVDNFYRLVDHQRVRLQKAMLSDRDGFFGGDLNKTEDLLDFLVWKKQADKLGITMTDEDVAIAVRHEMLYQNPGVDEVKMVDDRLRQQFRGYSVDTLTAALKDEFRVRTAKSALLGETHITRTALPIGATPGELFDWYKDARTTVRVGLIEVPVANFVDKVTEEPTEADLKALFDKYKNVEYDPTQERPGFKDPRKVRAEWFDAPYDSPYFIEAAKRGRVFQAVRQFGAAAVTADGTPAGMLATAFALSPLVADAPLDELYREYVQSLPSWTSPIAFGVRSGIHDSSVLRPENIAILVGSSVASGATGSGPFTGPLAMEGRVVIREIRDRARIGATAILSGGLDPAPLAIDAILTELTPKPPTEAVLQGLLREREREQLTRRLINADLETFRAEVTRRSAGSDRNNLEAFINEYIHARKFQRGSSQLVDRFALPEDAGLARVREAFNRGRFFHGGGGDPTGAMFAAFVADGPQNQQASSRPELFRVQFVPTETNTFGIWRVEDREPRAVPFDQARPRVVSAWKFERARGLAKAEAERLAAEAKNKTDLELRDLALKASGRGLIELAPLAKWNSRMSFSGGGPGYEPPVIPQDKVKFPQGMATPIVDMRKLPVGSTIVTHDYPKSAYYVTALIAKDEPSTDAFRMVYKSSMGPPQVRDGLFDIFYGERAEQFRKELMKQLREDARLVVYKTDSKTDAVE
jgi:hypothetical protein